MSAVEKTIVVTPSSKAAVLEVFHQAADDKPKKKVEDGQELPCVAGHLLSGLSMYSNPSLKYHLKNIKRTQINLPNTNLLLAFFPVAVVFDILDNVSCLVCQPHTAPLLISFDSPQVLINYCWAF